MNVQVGARHEDIVASDALQQPGQPASHFAQMGFDEAAAQDFAKLLELARRQRPALILLDLELTGGDFLTACRRLCEELCLPVVILTRATNPGLIHAVAPGGTEVHSAVPPPTGDSHMPAGAGSGLQAPGVLPAVLQADDLLIDLNNYRAQRAGQTLPLTPKEFRLLVEFVRNQGVILTRELLYTLVWGTKYKNDRRTLDVHISWLRKKIEDHPENPRRIKTIRGKGYRFEG